MRSFFGDAETRRRRPSSPRLRLLIGGAAAAVVAAAAYGVVAALDIGAPPPPSVDLVELAPDADWRSGYGRLDWALGSPIEAGSANQAPNAPLESGVRAQLALTMHPQWVDYGYIEGEFDLPRPLARGDRFTSSFGFLTDEAGFESGARVVGEADFSLLVIDSGSGLRRTVFDIHDVAYDWRTPRPDVDLSTYAGATRLILRVDAGENADQDWAAWWDAKIRNR
jgi:hypothetical protein